MIYLIITTCINNRFGIQNYDVRKKEYMHAISTSISHFPVEINPIIVENSSVSPTYLDNFKHNEENIPVLYTGNNDRNINNKGVIELFDIKDVIQHFSIKDDDIIIKLTGRYILKSPLFLNEVIKHPEVSAFVKFFDVDSKEFNPSCSVLGVYAVHASLLRYWSHLTMNYYSSAEVAFANHIRLHAQNIREMKFLDLECIFADNYRHLHV
jgi:hypothetical protein